MSILYKSDTATSGIWRAMIVSVDNDARCARIYIPTLHRKLKPFKDMTDPKSGAIEENLKSFPLAYFCCPGVYVKFEVGDNCWVMFENSDVNYPIIVGQLGTTLPEGDVVNELYGGGSSGGYSDIGGIGTGGVITGCAVYSLDDSAIESIATCITGEGGGSDISACRQYASHAANLVDQSKPGDYSQSAVLSKVKPAREGGWYASDSWTRGCSDEARQAVKEVFLEGKRFIPRYVVEFDTFPNDIKNAKKREEYSSGEVLKNIYGSEYKFWDFFLSGDIAGYTDSMYSKYKDDDTKLSENAIPADGVVGGAIQWATIKANTPVSQGGALYVWGAKGPKNYDCSGFVWAAFHDGGNLTSLNYAATSGMISEYTKNGFVALYPKDGIDFKTGLGLQAGDILLKPGRHTELMVSSTHRAGAHSSSYAADRQVSVESYSNYSNGGYEVVLRYRGG